MKLFKHSKEYYKRELSDWVDCILIALLIVLAIAAL